MRPIDTSPCDALPSCPPARRAPQPEAQRTVVTTSVPLPIFSAVRSCVPFNVLVAVGANNSVTMTAEQEVVNATRVQLAGTLVILSLARGFTSASPINVTVTSSEKGALRSVQNAGSGTLVVGPGFQLPELRIESAGVGGVHVRGADIQRLQVLASGCAGLRGASACSARWLLQPVQGL